MTTTTTARPAAQRAFRHPQYSFRYCSAAPLRPIARTPDVTANPARLEAIIAAQDKWVNFTALRYGFFGTGPWAVPTGQADVIRTAFDDWAKVGIGLAFNEVRELGEAEIRIGFLPGDGSWSYVGTQVLHTAANERTMSFGWPLDGDPSGFATALHEIGHTLGMPHEHQNPYAGIVWDEEQVYASLGGPPNNWDRATTYLNVLEKLDTNFYRGSHWDPRSIMQYPFAAGLIKEPADYRDGINPPGVLSPSDIAWVRTWYPGRPGAPGTRTAERGLEPDQPRTIELKSGAQEDFSVRVARTGVYTFTSLGASDTVLCLFEDVDGQPRFLAGDNDSGTDRIATIRCRLRPGRNYHLRLRLVYQHRSELVTVLFS